MGEVCRKDDSLAIAHLAVPASRSLPKAAIKTMLLPWLHESDVLSNPTRRCRRRRHCSSSLLPPSSRDPGTEPGIARLIAKWKFSGTLSFISYGVSPTGADQKGLWKRNWVEVHRQAEPGWRKTLSAEQMKHELAKSLAPRPGWTSPAWPREAELEMAVRLRELEVEALNTEWFHLLNSVFKVAGSIPDVRSLQSFWRPPSSLQWQICLWIPSHSLDEGIR